MPPLWRMRESQMLLERLRAASGERVAKEELRATLEGIRASCGENIWTGLLGEALEDYGEDEAPADDWTEHLHETLAGCRRDGRARREGIWLSTIHAAKGTEHDCVAVAGSWKRQWQADREEARRLLYVAMTRAKKALAVVDRVDRPCELLAPLEAGGMEELEDAVHGNGGEKLKEYRLMGPAQFDLGFAGRGDLARTERIAAQMRALRSGDGLEWADEKSGIVLKRNGCAVAMLSAEGARAFREDAGRLEKIRVMGVYGWRREDAEPEWRNTCVAERWGIPLCEAEIKTRAGD